MARVDTKWLIDNLQWSAIALLGAIAAFGWRHHIRSVTAERRRTAEARTRADEERDRADEERRRADIAHGRADEAVIRLGEVEQRLDTAATERAGLKTELTEAKALLQAVVTEARLCEDERQQKPNLRLVKRAVGPVAALSAWMWAAKRTVGITVASTAAAVVVATYSVTHPVYDIPNAGEHAPPAVAAPSQASPPRQLALPAPKVPATTSPTATETPTAAPPPATTVAPTAATTTTAAPAVPTTPPRTTSATAPITTTSTPAATPTVPVPEGVVTPTLPAGEPPKGKPDSGKPGRVKAKDTPPDTAVPAAPPTPALITLPGMSTDNQTGHLLHVHVPHVLDLSVG